MSQYYVVEGKTRKQLRTLAKIVRETLHLENAIWFPIVELLDVLPMVFPKFNYEIVEDDELPTLVHADTDIVSGNIRIKESIYNGACDGNGRDRMTIAHEICHFLMLCSLGFKIQRSFGKPKPCEDPEWQAKCMAAELMIDKRLVKNMDPHEIAEVCGVSIEAAKYQYNIYRSEK